jgi:cytochrome c oxidase subunit 2
MEVYEKVFALVAAAMLVILLAVLAYAAVVLKITLPQHAAVIAPKPGESLAAAVLETAPFSTPGVKQIGPGKYEAVIIAQAWSFLPNEIDIPAGSEVTFRVTSADLTHGFFIPRTTVNMMVIPGQISVEKYRFDRPGTYILLCHEYCGLLHHTMAGKVVAK